MSTYYGLIMDISQIQQHSIHFLLGMLLLHLTALLRSMFDEIVECVHFKGR